MTVKIVDYKEEYLSDFQRISHEWLETYYTVEPEDDAILNTPHDHIIAPGGVILMALLDGEVVGTVALRKETNDVFFMEKMGVTPKAQGKKIGRLLAEEIITRARNLGAQKIVLESGKKLTAALALYESLGFTYLDPSDSPFNRCDVKMECELK